MSNRYSIRSVRSGHSVHNVMMVELQAKILPPLLLVVLAAGWIWMWVSSFFAFTTLFRLLSILIVSLCSIAYLLMRQNLRLSIYLLLASVWLAIVTTHQIYNVFIFMYFLALVSLMASVLTGKLASSLITLLSIAYIIASSAAHEWNLIILTPVMLIAFSWLTGTIITDRVNQALTMSRDYQDYITQQMNEAREHRAKLIQLTKALQEAQAELQQTNIQLRHARHAAEEGRRLKAQFAANVSHELRTPINLIVGFSEIMVTAPEAYGAPLPGGYRADMHAIYRNAKHLQSLINDVLDVSQIEAGRMALVKEECNPLEVIEAAVTLARDLIESKGLRFEVSLPSALPTIWLDQTRIRQVILNLLSNAARFTDKGTISLKVQLEYLALHMSITDTGIGIQDSDLGRIFEEFHQLESSLSRRQGGSGLGLALSKQFAQMHGGEIWVESAGLNQGSTFHIRLPLNGKSSTYAQSVVALSNISSEPKYFIVWEQDPAIFQFFKRYTQKHQAIAAHSLEDAQHLVETISPTALVIGKTQDSEIMSKLGSKTPIIVCSMPKTEQELSSLKSVQPQALIETLKNLQIPLRTALIVHDMRDVVRMYTRMLNSVSPSCEVNHAFDAYIGLEMMTKRRLDLVILDLSIPNGELIAENIMADPVLARIPMIRVFARPAVPAADQQVQREQISLLRTDGFHPSELVRCIETLLDILSPANANS